MAGIMGGNDELLGKSLDIANLVASGGQSAPSSGIAGNRVSPDAQILLHDFQLRGIPAKIGMAGVGQELKQGLKMYRQSKTILAIKKLSPTEAQIHFFTLDNEPTFQKLVNFWVGKLKEAGGRVIYDSVADPHISKALQQAGVQLQQSTNPKYKLMGLL
jgi:hypothetical protein